jgi:hypothetical protein
MSQSLFPSARLVELSPESASGRAMVEVLLPYVASKGVDTLRGEFSDWGLGDPLQTADEDCAGRSRCRLQLVRPMQVQFRHRHADALPLADAWRPVFDEHGVSVRLRPGAARERRVELVNRGVAAREFELRLVPADAGLELECETLRLEPGEVCTVRLHGSPGGEAACFWLLAQVDGTVVDVCELRVAGERMGRLDVGCSRLELGELHRGKSLTLSLPYRLDGREPLDALLVNNCGESRLLKLLPSAEDRAIEVVLDPDQLPAGCHQDYEFAVLYVDTPQLEQRRIRFLASYSLRYFQLSPRRIVCSWQRLISQVPVRIRAWRVVGEERDELPQALLATISDDRLLVRCWAEPFGGASIEVTAKRGAGPPETNPTIELVDPESGLRELITLRLGDV